MGQIGRGRERTIESGSGGETVKAGESGRARERSKQFWRERERLEKARESGRELGGAGESWR